MKEEKSTRVDKSESERLENNLRRIRHTIIIISGKGGVGKSTVAVNLAHGLAQEGKRVGILDVDIHGPSIAKMLGIEGRTLEISPEDNTPMPIRVTDKIVAMTIASLIGSPDDPVVWRGPLKMGAIRQFLQDIRWPELDYLIIDSPPGTGDEPLSVIQIVKNVSGAIVVSTPQDIALLDARKTIRFSQKLNVPVLGLIENMSTFHCPHCGKVIDIFKGLGIEKAAHDFSLEILGKIPIDTNIVYTGDKGISYLARHADSESAVNYMKIVKRIMVKLPA
ncbi:MAG: Mrp/NBP35 family ATP-binding protein [Candidatus Cloacimonetes bacterium]|nr:Mrp/NBP35 family ATP-binding protein [Candidatus Cloacimonadota bacterium]